VAYQPIENYGVIGNMHTVALVGMNGSVDCFCDPHFDSPSVFAAILDERKGRHFKIAPIADGVTNKQMYWLETNVLVTRSLSPDGVGEVIDFMPAGIISGNHQRATRIPSADTPRHRGPRRHGVPHGMLPGLQLRQGCP
jgi:GH15 family glucan-1,4-alpha-glucosidase